MIHIFVDNSHCARCVAVFGTVVLAVIHVLFAHSSNINQVGHDAISVSEPTLQIPVAHPLLSFHMTYTT